MPGFGNFAMNYTPNRPSGGGTSTFKAAPKPKKTSYGGGGELGLLPKNEE
jgi:hypothetical protein